MEKLAALCRCGAAIVAFACAGLISGGSAQADDDPSETASDADKDRLARVLFERGDKKFGEGDYEGAASDFERAYELSGRSALLYNLGNAYEQLRRYVEALRMLRAYLPTAPADRRAEVTARIRKLEPLAEIQRNNPEPTPPPVVVIRPAPEPPSEPVALETVLGGSLLGLGAVGIGVGTVFGVMALDARAEADGLCREAAGERWCPPAAVDALDRDTQNALIADLSIGLGAAAVVGGAVLLVIGLGAAEGEDAEGDATESDVQFGFSAAPLIGATAASPWQASGLEVQLVGQF